jgi:hypothetical protein
VIRDGDSGLPAGLIEQEVGIFDVIGVTIGANGY